MLWGKKTKVTPSTTREQRHACMKPWAWISAGDLRLPIWNKGKGLPFRTASQRLAMRERNTPGFESGRI